MKKLWSKTKTFTSKCKRVWHALKKPSKQEFESTAKVSAVGIGLIGLIGFIVAMAMRFFK